MRVDSRREGGRIEISGAMEMVASWRRAMSAFALGSAQGKDATTDLGLPEGGVPRAELEVGH